MYDKQTQPTGAEQRLHDHNIQLPPIPTPLGAYVEVVQTGNLLFLSGMLPVAGGKPAYLGRLGAELTVEDGRKAAAIACLNVLSAARHHLGSLDKVSRVVRLGVSMKRISGLAASHLPRLTFCRLPPLRLPTMRATSGVRISSDRR